MKCKITAKHIREGERADKNFCPIALAIGDKKAFDQVDIQVGMFSIWVGDKQYELPKEAVEFIDAFDRGQPVEPFTLVAKRIRM